MAPPHNMVPVQPQLNSVTVTHKLDDTKYVGLSKSMRRDLGEKNKLSMVDH